ncbi:MAG TPA: DNA polymerase III subunit beta [Candidatus Paceibacterota bacterium]|jgi:DNA polymerase-3 subunit beta|nr:DNA polymerase III subunit beta [Candidatus Paceibacterota bacterium]
MKIKCKTEKLKNAVALAEKMSGKNLSLPTLQAILIIASGNSLKIRSTNLAVGVEIEVPATITKEGVVLIKGDILSNVVSNLTGSSEITLSLEGENLLIESQGSNTVIKCLPQEDFPTLPVVEGETFKVKTEVLQEGIRSVYFCCATTEIKPEISSIFIYTDQDNLVFVATDSFRLSEKKIKVKGLPEISKILIPYKNISDFLRVLDLLQGEVLVSFSKNQISISGDGVYFTSRLIDGAFPDYRLIIPKEEKTKVVLMRSELLSTLRLSTVFADKFFQVIFSVNNSKKSIIIQSKNNDVGSSTSAIEAVLDGSDIEVTFNLKYFLDVFQTISSDSISISFTEPNKPIIIKGVSDNSFIYLLMPTNR